MMKYIVLFLFFSSGYTFAQPFNSIVRMKFVEDASICDLDNSRNHYEVAYNDQQGPVLYSTGDYDITLLEVNPAARTYYDFQSNTVCRFISQDKANPLNMHAVFMVDPVGLEGFPDRKTKYFFSDNGGMNWSYVIYVPEARSGFPYLALTNDGRALILNHTTDGGTIQRSQLYVDIAPGAGSFTRLDPGIHSPISTDQPIWPAGISTSTNKIVFLASINNTSFDSTFRNLCTSQFPPVFSGYVPLQYAARLTYSISRYENKIGIVYVTQFSSPCGFGCIKYIESTNDGLSWSSPVEVYSANWITDSLGCFRSLDLTYMAGIPKVIFGLAHVGPFEESFYPDLYSKMMIWSPNINGGQPVRLDSAGGLTGSVGTDGYVSVTRGVMGASANGTALYAAWARGRTDTSSSGVNYFDIYFSYSVDGGSSWVPAIKVTNNSGPLRDCRYPSISPTNNTIAGDYYAHIIYQQDSVPGSYVQGQPKSLARMMYAKMNLGNIFLGVTGSSGIPESYSLSQNYPNPFNPTTKIRFVVSLDSRIRGNDKRGVIFKVYDILGHEVQTLVNKQLSPGTYEVEWNGMDFPSGVYYYTLTAGEFKETKKMVLIK